MPSIAGWYQVGKWEWRHKRHDLVARIEGSRGGWTGTIENDDRTIYTYSSHRLSTVKDHLIDEMRDLNRR